MKKKYKNEVDVNQIKLKIFIFYMFNNRKEIEINK